MSNINSVTEVIDASGQKRLPNGNFLYLIAATAAVTINLTKGGSNEIFQNAIGGLQMKRVKGWDYAYIVGAPGTSMTYFFGIGNFREDDTVLQQQIATVAGTVQVQPAPATALTDRVALVTAAGQHALFAANLLRKRITVFSDPANVGVHYLRTSGGANNIGYIQPGTYEEFDGTYAVDYNTATANDTLYFFEES